MSSMSENPPLAPAYDASIVIPSRDRSEQLRACLEAVAAQTHESFEIVVVDDASTDDTPRMLDAFAARWPDVRLQRLRHDEPAGANVSRNRGIRAARGRLVAFLDSDCVPRADWLERLLAGFTGDTVASVTGLVQDPDPSNVYELAFKGTHRLRPGAAHRLVGGNMAIRRSLLLERPLDEDLRWGCDEEGVFLWLRSEGYEQRVVPDAVVMHEHYYDRRSFFRQAYRGGEAAARLVYKYRLPVRLDMIPFLLAYLTVPYAAIHVGLAVVPVLCMAAALGAITWNDLSRKGKTLRETARSFPVLLAYYHVRLAGYAGQALRLALGRSGIRRERLLSARCPGGRGEPTPRSAPGGGPAA